MSGSMLYLQVAQLWLQAGNRNGSCQVNECKPLNTCQVLAARNGLFLNTSSLNTYTVGLNDAATGNGS